MNHDQARTRIQPIDPNAYARIVAFTGAGLSAASGVPTYRGQGGVWSSYRYEDVACQRAFERDPEAVWDFHDVRRACLAAASPCQAHRTLGALQAAHADTRIVTQNIDGLHQRGGATDVIELHGSIWRVRCRCPESPQHNGESPIGSRRCERCDAWRRPDITWFEDPMDPGPVRWAMDAMKGCDLLISIGTSGVVYPAAALPRVAAQLGARCIEINPEETPVSEWFGEHIRLDASSALSALFPKFG